MRNFIKKLFARPKQPSRFAGRKRRIFVEDVSRNLKFSVDITDEQISAIWIADRKIPLETLLAQEDNLMLLGFDAELHKIKYGALVEPLIT